MGTSGSFKPGQSGNPGGRPKENKILSAECQKYGGEVVALMLKIMRGEEIERTIIKASTSTTKAMKVKYRVAPTFTEQMDAAKWFADRGYGKAATVLAGEGGVGPSEIVIRLATPLPAIAGEEKAKLETDTINLRQHGHVLVIGE